MTEQTKAPATLANLKPPANTRTMLPGQQPCTCPSGDGSLRHPCQQHPADALVAHDLSSSEGARAYVAEFFANELQRHDFRAYISTRLAADFACALATGLAARQPVGQEPVAFDYPKFNAVGMACGLEDRGVHFLSDAARYGFDEALNQMKATLESIGPLYAAPPAQAVDPADPWRGLYSPDKMPALDGVNLYHVAHPDLPSWPKDEDEERGIGPLVTAQGFALEAVFGEYPDDDGEEVDYCAWLASWTPDAPAGDGWRLVCIQDTEDGPAAFFVRPLALIDSAPAPAVDLGQFRECVELMEWQERGHANPDFPSGDAKKHAEAMRLLALIDSQAVGDG